MLEKIRGMIDGLFGGAAIAFYFGAITSYFYSLWWAFRHGHFWLALLSFLVPPFGAIAGFIELFI